MNDTSKLPAWVTMDNFIARLQIMPPEHEYEYVSNRSCLFAQFLKARVPNPFVDSGNFWLNTDDVGRKPSFKLPDIFNRVALGRPRTFGGALERARTYL